MQDFKSGRNANAILEDKFTFHSQHCNLIKLSWCYGYLIMPEAQVELNIVPPGGGPLKEIFGPLKGHYLLQYSKCAVPKIFHGKQ